MTGLLDVRDEMNKASVRMIVREIQYRQKVAGESGTDDIATIVYQ